MYSKSITRVSTGVVGGERGRGEGEGGGGRVEGGGKVSPSSPSKLYFAPLPTPPPPKFYFLDETLIATIISVAHTCVFSSNQE